MDFSNELAKHLRLCPIKNQDDHEVSCYMSEKIDDYSLNKKTLGDAVGSIERKFGIWLQEAKRLLSKEVETY
jgi:hypothetical protein